MPSRVVVFDTSCLLCSKFIQKLLVIDQDALQYTGFESKFAQEILPAQLRLSPESVVFYDDGLVLLKSQAVLAILKYTDSSYRWLRIFRFLPTSILNLIYDWIARNRYAWFGQSSQCFMPEDKFKAKFLA